jgi:hypothetical protein
MLAPDVNTAAGTDQNNLSSQSYTLLKSPAMIMYTIAKCLQIPGEFSVSNLSGRSLLEGCARLCENVSEMGAAEALGCDVQAAAARNESRGPDNSNSNTFWTVKSFVWHNCRSFSRVFAM